MVNNVGRTTQTLSTELGVTTPFTTSDDVTVITGELGLGFLLFDENGTLGVITTYSSATEFIVTTYALSIDIQTILNLSY